jgi:succinoglycan biosynthesis transport protein ExoP
MNLQDYLLVLRRRWLSALIVAVVVVAAAAALSLTLPPRYTATTRLFFGVRAGESPSDLAQGSTFTEKQMASYEEVASSPLVLGEVIADLGLTTTADDLAKRVNADASPGTVVLDISVTETDAATAASVANAIGQQLTATVGSLTPEQSDGSEAVRATILAPAMIPLQQSSPNVPRNIALGMALGLLLGVGFALIRNLLDTKIRGDQDVRVVTDSPILGSIAFDEHVPEHPVIIADEPHSSPAEAIRRLRTNLQFIGNESECKTLVVTSSVPGEGKSTTSINLAVSMADAGARVILIDADLRRPSIANYTGVEGRAGLTSILIGRAELEDVTQPWRDTSLTILPSGPVPPNPSELLGSSAMAELLTELKSSYDVVLLDTPPLLPVTDATILTKMVGGALVVVGADRLHRGQLQESLGNLETAGAHVYGMVVNKVAKRDANAYGYGYGYGYTSYAPETTPTVDPGATAPVPAPLNASKDVPALSARSLD